MAEAIAIPRRTVKATVLLNEGDSSWQSLQSSIPGAGYRDCCCHSPLSSAPRHQIRGRILLSIVSFVIERLSLALITCAAAGFEGEPNNSRTYLDSSSGASCLDDTGKTCSANSVEEEIPLCGLYVAESTLPGAGIGIYSGVEHQSGSVIGYGDVCIPIIDLKTHWREGYEDSWSWYNPFGEYEWSGLSMGMAFESATGDTTAVCPGINCMINGHLGLLNLAQSTPAVDDAAARERRTDLRQTDPGVGSYARYHNCTNSARMHIPAGSECGTRQMLTSNQMQVVK
jgi:hypothetical protein